MLYTTKVENMPRYGTLLLKQERNYEVGESSTNGLWKIDSHPARRIVKPSLAPCSKKASMAPSQNGSNIFGVTKS